MRFPHTTYSTHVYTYNPPIPNAKTAVFMYVCAKLCFFHGKKKKKKNFACRFTFSRLRYYIHNIFLRYHETDFFKSSPHLAPVFLFLMLYIYNKNVWN